MFCAGDFAAIGAMQALHDKGLSVPSAMGIVGFANEPFSDFITPRLSTVEQNAHDMGHLTAKALIRAINGNGPLRSEEHTSELQSRPHLVCRLLLEKKNSKKTSTRLPPVPRPTSTIFRTPSSPSAPFSRN